MIAREASPSSGSTTGHVRNRRRWLDEDAMRLRLARTGHAVYFATKPGSTG